MQGTDRRVQGLSFGTMRSSDIEHSRQIFEIRIAGNYLSFLVFARRINNRISHTQPMSEAYQRLDTRMSPSMESFVSC